jgi:hypothetical protein
MDTGTKKFGMMEQWNDGRMGKIKQKELDLFFL